MISASDVLEISKKIAHDVNVLGACASNTLNEKSLYDQIVTNRVLRKKTEKLFKDGHHARSVEEAFKYIDNFVKKKAGLSSSKLTGASLMQEVFSLNNPKLKLNEGVSDSERNEQNGYMQLLAGCMTGIRNPRAHESDWEDTEKRALQLLGLANHLIERVSMAEVVLV